MGIIICPCQRCSQDIQYDMGQFHAGEEVECPHCHKATTLYVPQTPQPVLTPPKPKGLPSIAWFFTGVTLTVVVLACAAVFFHPAKQQLQPQDSTPQALVAPMPQVPANPSPQAMPEKNQDSQSTVVQKDPFATGNLMSAIQYGGTPDTVKLLLAKGADPNAQDNEGWHPLQLAAKRGDVKIVQLLLDNGAYVDATNLDGASALMSAAYRGHMDVVRLLAEKGANVNLLESDGVTPLMAAVEGGQTTNTVTFLVEKGADINATNHSGDSVLMEAADAGEFDVVKYLLSQGVNINAEDVLGNNALFRAEEKDHRAIVDLLRQAGATKSSETPGDQNLKTVFEKLMIADPGLTNTAAILSALTNDLQKSYH
jgi:ankyrin repeat protein